ncbi:MAG: hypothetical protein ING84_10225 [Cytophagales bacterium]|nr:hypothetical protein [Cytophagales bacterium]MCA6367773.1 hypothetical protein [Cytophagales bacterium]MCA6369944.1 hypothetical protein [Cytophagales bacterium]MCA6375102.1 hypothetical protein [Cytophagales bacterium]MCA6382587.1 hypothetical protein [Cytophagales bacterium]
MTTISTVFNSVYSKILSEEARKKSEVVIVIIAIVSFLLHLLLIFLVDLKVVAFDGYKELFNNPIAAIYTPFSFILIYEVYLLIYYLPKSTTTYIGKQYEIMTLIVIRRIFKDLSQLQLTPDWFKVPSDLLLTYDLIATMVLFLLILLFYRLNRKSAVDSEPGELSSEIAQFIKMKTIIAKCLVPIFVLLAIFSLGEWIYDSFFSPNHHMTSIQDVNKIFFDNCFTILILTDVLLLLISFLHTDKFNRVIRNSGFIISTILIKLSFGIEGLLNIILIVVAVLFGVIILAIHNQFDRLKPKPL